MFRILSSTIVIALAAGAAGATAQVTRVLPERSQRGWLGISYEVTTVRTNGAARQTLVIQEVIDDSPAQRAGVEAGDTILAVNDIRATEELMRSLSSSIAPGDEVRLRVRRDGRDQQLSVRAGQWPNDIPFEWFSPDRERFLMIDPDSLRGRVEIYLDSARRHIELMPRMRIIPDVRVRRFFPDSVFMMPDSVRVWRSPGGRGFSYIFPRDSIHVRLDSLWIPFDRNMGAFQLRVDSLLRMEMDTLRGRIRGFDRGEWMVLSDSSLLTPRGGFGIAMLGERGIAGAELTELDPGLGEYFGTDRGVLVVRVPEGTPAHRAGLQAGDVVLRANGRDVRTIRDLRSEIQRRTPREPVQLEILRKRARQTIELRQD
ncbi:MAG: PDZ domain-containing protein [Gemmatimonadetes bacterium]|nr:PDZ domain-containing protein [Gemmatimonadota bacterium]